MEPEEFLTDRHQGNTRVFPQYFGRMELALPEMAKTERGAGLSGKRFNIPFRPRWRELLDTTEMSNRQSDIAVWNPQEG